MTTNLHDLSAYLQRRFLDAPAIGAIRGRTDLRDAVAEKLSCSQLEAEELVDSLVANHLITFEGEHGEPGAWHFYPDATTR
jgi:hypothetical protein